MRRLCSAVVLVLLLAGEARPAVSAPAAGSASNVVASVGSLAVTREALQERLWSADIKHRLFTSPFPKLREEVLEEMIRERLLALEARRSGIRKDPDFLTLTEIAVDGWLATNYLKTVFDPATEPTEAELAPALPKSFERIRVRHIAVQTEEIARDVEAQLAAGGDFKALAREFSLAPEGQQREGELGWVIRGASDIYPNDLMEKVFELPVGKNSGVLQSPLGYEIFRVEERVPMSPVEIEHFKGQARSLISIAKRDRAVEKLRADHHLKVDLKAAAALAAKKDLDAATVLGEIDGSRLTAGALRLWAASIKNPAQRPPLGSAESVASAVGGLLTQRAMRREMEARGFFKSADHRRRLEQYLEGAAVSFLGDRILAQVKVDERAVADFLAKNRAGFQSVQKLKIGMIVAEDEAMARRLHERLRSGAAWDLLARAYSTDPSSSRGGDLGVVFMHQVEPAYRELLASIKVGAYTEPFDAKGKWTILKLDEREEPRKATDDEARELSAEQILMEAQRRHMDRYFAGLKKKFPVKINAQLRDSTQPPLRSGSPAKKN